jgi:uncharacterized membrane protein (DUF4010 family)
MLTIASAIQDTVKLIPDILVSADPILESDDLLVLVQKLAIAILIGGLIGLEREHARPQEEKTFAGIRTFPLIAIFGFTSALISTITSYWVYLALFLGFALLVSIAHFFSAKEGRLGGTSEITIFIVFLLGSLVFWNFLILAAVIAVIVVLFLSLKLQLHTFVGRVSAEDIYATVKLAIITVIILPLLPDAAYDPLGVLNPRHIWYMVILVSGLSFIGYILIKVLGKDKGIPITGLMGGLVSSTAVTFSLSRKSSESKQLSGSSAVGIMYASAVMYLRIFFITLIINISLIADLWIPMLIFAVTGAAAGLFISSKINTKDSQDVEIKNPFELKSALLFGLAFGIILFAAKAAEEYIGEGGVYAASALAGFTSVDAIIISVANLSRSFTSDAAVISIIIATISNNIFKSIITVVYGTREMRKYVFPGLGAVVLVSVLYLIYILIFK